MLLEPLRSSGATLVGIIEFDNAYKEILGMLLNTKHCEWKHEILDKVGFSVRTWENCEIYKMCF